MNKRQSYTADIITALYCRLSRDDELQGDCNNQTENDMTPFINIFNEFYAKDTSRKI